MTDRDIVTGPRRGQVTEGTRVEIATTELKTLAPDDDAAEAVRWMRKFVYHGLPVVEASRSGSCASAISQSLATVLSLGGHQRRRADQRPSFLTPANGKSSI